MYAHDVCSVPSRKDAEIENPFLLEARSSMRNVWVLVSLLCTLLSSVSFSAYLWFEISMCDEVQMKIFKPRHHVGEVSGCRMCVKATS